MLAQRHGTASLLHQSAFQGLAGWSVALLTARVQAGSVYLFATAPSRRPLCVCSWMQDADPPAGLHLVSSAKEVSVLKRNVAPSRESPKAFKPLAGQKDLEDANFAEACWLLD